MSELSNTLDALEHELTRLREEIADTLTLDAVQSREADKLREEHDHLSALRDELISHGQLELGSRALRDFEQRYAALLVQEANHRQKHLRLMARLEVLRTRMEQALSRIDVLHQAT